MKLTLKQFADQCGIPYNLVRNSMIGNDGYVYCSQNFQYDTDVICDALIKNLSPKIVNDKERLERHEWELNAVMTFRRMH